MEMEKKRAVSEYDGGGVSRFGWVLLAIFVAVITLGICLPWAMVWIKTYDTEHTVIEGRRLKFIGTGIGLLGNWIKWWLLTIITIGIFGFFVPTKMRKWVAQNTFFADTQ